MSQQFGPDVPMPMVDTQTLEKVLSSLSSPQTPKQLKVKFNTFSNSQDLFPLPDNSNSLMLLFTVGENAPELSFSDSAIFPSVVGTCDEARILDDGGTFSSLSGAAGCLVDGAADEDCSWKFKCDEYSF